MAPAPQPTRSFRHLAIAAVGAMFAAAAVLFVVRQPDASERAEAREVLLHIRDHAAGDEVKVGAPLHLEVKTTAQHVLIANQAPDGTTTVHTAPADIEAGNVPGARRLVAFGCARDVSAQEIITAMQQDEPGLEGCAADRAFVVVMPADALP